MLRKVVDMKTSVYAISLSANEVSLERCLVLYLLLVLAVSEHKQNHKHVLYKMGCCVKPQLQIYDRQRLDSKTLLGTKCICVMYSFPANNIPYHLHVTWQSQIHAGTGSFDRPNNQLTGSHS